MSKLNWYAADFETAADEKAMKNSKTYVWAWGITKVSQDKEEFYYGTDILSFIAKTLELGGTYWFHNEKFDGSFIINYLMNNGFHVSEAKSSYDMKSMELKVVCNSMGQIYQIVYKVENVVVKIQNSLLKIPGSIKSIAKSLKLDMQKGEIDYKKYREEGADNLNQEDLDYLERDVRILAKALYEICAKNGHTSLTVGSDCLKSFKKLQKNYDRLFSNKITKEEDKFIRKAYRGGYVYVNPKYQNITIKNGATFDKNSMYPGVMHGSSKYRYPYGEPKYYKGAYKENKEYPLFIQRVIVTAKLKENRWPTINLRFGIQGHSEYATVIDNQELILTDVDLLWLHKNYIIENYQELDGYMFRAGTGFFDEYIDSYMKMKEEATTSKDPVKRQLAKLMLNNLYGKFGTNPIRISKLPILVNGVTKWVTEKEFYRLKGLKNNMVYLRKFDEYKQVGYIPVACFCTAYARNELWKAMEILWEYFCYCDTDSLHILIAGLEIALKFLDVHETKLGAWAKESIWDEAIFLRAKTYAEHIVDKEEPYWDIKACGMPENIKNQIDIKDFKIGTQWISSAVIREWLAAGKFKLALAKDYKFVEEAKLVPKQVQGGTILVERPFKIVE